MPKSFSLSHRIKSFGYALKGIKTCLFTQHNFIIHTILALIAIIMGFILEISNSEWIAIIIVIGMVMATEIINTSIEELVNIVSPERNKKAGAVKDLAAGAVLVTAIAAFITGTIIFIPKILEYL